MSNKTSNIKRNVISQKQNSDKYVRIIKEEVDDPEGGSTVYVKVQELAKSMINPTTDSLEKAVSDATDGIDLLGAFVSLAQSEKKRLKSAKEVLVRRSFISVITTT